MDNFIYGIGTGIFVMIVLWEIVDGAGAADPDRKNKKRKEHRIKYSIGLPETNSRPSMPPVKPPRVDYLKDEPLKCRCTAARREAGEWICAMSGVKCQFKEPDSSACWEIYKFGPEE